MTSELSDRKLRFDGVSEIEPDQLVRFLLLGVPSSKLRVTSETPEVTQFNEQVSDEEALRLVEPEPVQLDMSWQLPERYQNLNLERHFAIQFEFRCPEDYTQAQYNAAIGRIATELAEVEKRNIQQFMRTIIYILDELQANNVVWGVGRGSSCASYLLFILGLHVVDCVRMNVPLEEFFHD